jgi:hypothetical protein
MESDQHSSHLQRYWQDSGLEMPQAKEVQSIDQTAMMLKLLPQQLQQRVSLLLMARTSSQRLVSSLFRSCRKKLG